MKLISNFVSTTDLLRFNNIFSDQDLPGQLDIE